MKSKKGIMVEFLLRLIVAIIFLWGATAIGKSLFRVTSQGEQSFDNLITLVNKIREEGGMESMNLIMDQKTALIGLTSNAEYVKNTQFSKIGSAKRPREQHYFWRPNQCENNKACLCLCQSGWKSLSENPEKNPHKVPNEYSCKKVICKSFDSINFLDTIKSENFGAYYGSPLDLQVESVEGMYELEGGFVYLRTEDTKMGFPGRKLRSVQVYVQKNKNKIGVCFKSPCITDEMINERSPVNIGGSSKANFMFIEGWMIGVDTNDDKVPDTFYYIKKITKDLFDEYYYEYKYGIRPQSAPEQASFLETTQEKSKWDFESKFINYAKEGKLVEIDYDNKEADIKNFAPETRMDKDGKVKLS